MKRLLVVLVLVLGSLLVTGCATMVENPEARDRRIRQVWGLQMRGLVEDWDYLWLIDQNTGMTQWNPWVGI